ncbi:NAD(P)-binding protein [Ceratobasidium sp. AG-I]|nr:NAD(P)-binding protein [Ceratobasidium sp. AG-I]
MSNSNTLLHDKKVIVIGGSSGIGYAVADAAISNGASVVVASSSQIKIDGIIERLRKSNTNATVTGQAVDITNFESLTSFLTKEAPFDHLVITAGEVPTGTQIQKGVDLREQLQDSLNLRYWAVLNAAQHIHTNGLVRPGGSFTMTIGTVQARPLPGWGFFSGVVGAVETATRGLALDLKPLRVNTIAPGYTDTALTEQFPPDLRKAFIEKAQNSLPVGRIGKPEEVAEAYIFAMKYLTGQVITVDGGGVLV